MYSLGEAPTHSIVALRRDAREVGNLPQLCAAAPPALRGLPSAHLFVLPEDLHGLRAAGVGLDGPQLLVVQHQVHVVHFLLGAACNTERGIGAARRGGNELAAAAAATAQARTSSREQDTNGCDTVRVARRSPLGPARRKARTTTSSHLVSVQGVPAEHAGPRGGEGPVSNPLGPLPMRPLWVPGPLGDKDRRQGPPQRTKGKGRAFNSLRTTQWQWKV